ncbi:MAG: DNA primase [Ilumatobacteraceae bacterium]|nr:DNA primase [Ilumatobacteraceae bacterium]
MAIAADDIEALRQRISIVEVVQSYVALRRVGRNWVGLCPFHAEKSGSFNVREETARYRCFGCGASGDIFKFVQDIEHVDFVGAVESLAGKYGYQLTYTSGTESKDRQRRKKLVEAMKVAADWYHDRLLNAPDTRAARDYLRTRGLAGDAARQFRLGWAPDDWDALSLALAQDHGITQDVLRDCGLAFMNKRDRMQDAFRARILFPIISDTGDVLAFGGRILPGSTDPAKYKNSPETPIYSKSRTLYGLNWAKADIVRADQVIICEGYTDVIGFHRAGVPRAVATCGTALTEEHVRILKRFANKVVLAFDADAAGQGAAERFYEWEAKYEVSVSVAQFPKGKDPGELAQSDPDALRAAVDGAQPFLGFRLQRVLDANPARTPEERARTAERAIAVINEHPNVNVRKIYAGQIATHTGLPVGDVVPRVERRERNPRIDVAASAAPSARENAEFAAIAMLLQNWDSIAPWLVEELFPTDVMRRAFVAVAESSSAVEAAIEAADPEAREVLERAVVVDIDANGRAEAFNLLSAAVRRELAARRGVTDPNVLRADRDARLHLEKLESPEGDSAAAFLLGWLQSSVVAGDA